MQRVAGGRDEGQQPREDRLATIDRRGDETGAQFNRNIENHIENLVEILVLENRFQ